MLHDLLLVAFLSGIHSNVALITRLEGVGCKLYGSFLTISGVAVRSQKSQVSWVTFS